MRQLRNRQVIKDQDAIGRDSLHSKPLVAGRPAQSAAFRSVPVTASLPNMELSLDGVAMVRPSPYSGPDTSPVNAGNQVIVHQRLHPTIMRHPPPRSALIRSCRRACTTASDETEPMMLGSTEWGADWEQLRAFNMPKRSSMDLNGSALTCKSLDSAGQRGIGAIVDQTACRWIPSAARCSCGAQMGSTARSITGCGLQRLTSAHHSRDSRFRTAR